MTGLWFANLLLPGGWARRARVLVRDGRVARVETGVDAAPSDERAEIGVPGLPDVHSHAFQRGMAGRAERAGHGPDSFWTWREVMYRFAGVLDPPAAEAIATLLYAELLEAGFTRVGEFHYLHHTPDGRPYDAIDEMATRLVAAARRTGIGLTLLPCLYRFGDFGAVPAHAGQRRFLCSREQFARLMQACRTRLDVAEGDVLGVAPHSLRAVDPRGLAEAVALAGEGPIHIHAAEQRREVEACLGWSGLRPVAWLLEHAPVGPRWCLIHATHAQEAEWAGLAARSAVVGLCPVTEASLGDGIFAATSYLGADGRVAVGTDSNIAIDLAGELRQLEYTQRLRDFTRNALAPPGRSCGRTLLEAALQGGAQALGAGPAGTAGIVAGVAVGEWADIVALDPQHPSLMAALEDEWLDAWIFAAGRAAIDRVWARGRRVVEAGRHVGRNEANRAYEAAMRRLWAQA